MTIQPPKSLRQETKKLFLYEEVRGNKTIVYRQHKEDETQELVKIYEISDERITYLYGGTSVEEIIIEGFDDIPPVISPFGYGFEERAIDSFFKYKLEDDIKKVIISKEGESKKRRNSLVINLNELEDLMSDIRQEQRACEDTKRILVKNFLSDRFPSLSLDYQETNNNKRLILRNLNKKLIEQLTADDVEKIGRFYVEASQKYSRQDIVKRMLINLQKNTQLITLQEIIKRYEKLLAENPPESSWQSFFDEYIPLFDSRYIRKLDYKNIATGLTKYPDLVLVDIYGYVDFFELKKSSTPILQYDRSHKTFYWSKDISMAISQASDYLQKAKENSLSYAKTIKEETATEDDDGLSVNIINPRAIIVAGSTKELNTDKKQNHFKNLRESLKDIEFVLYDELLERLKNLLSLIKL